MLNNKNEFLQRISLANNKLFRDGRLPPTSMTYVVNYSYLYIKKNPVTKGTTISMDTLKTDKCAIKYIDTMGSKKVVVMNFANRHNQGGGYLKGARAQEEDLMRVIPTMYPSFNKVNFPYESDTVLITSDLTIMRDSDSNYKLLPENEWRTISVVSAAAQNLKYEEFDEACVRRTLENMYCAIKSYIPDADTLILGAWGCGAFGNDPKIIAPIMNEINLQYGGQFKHIVFSIPPHPNHDVFEDIILTTK